MKQNILEEKKMEGQEYEDQLHTSRIVKVDSLATWDLYVTQANPIVVHFTAAWCMPSVAMNPLFEELALRYPEVQFLIVDVDEVKEVATRLDVKAMPNFLVMKEGKQVDKVVGANPEEIRKRIHGNIQHIHAYVA